MGRPFGGSITGAGTGRRTLVGVVCVISAGIGGLRTVCRADVTEVSPCSYLSVFERPMRLDDRYCGAYVTWHALRYVGNPKPMAEVLADLGPGQGVGRCSLLDVRDALRREGARVRAVRLTPSALFASDGAYVLWFPSSVPGGAGHFVFVRTMGTDRLVMLDGIRVRTARAKHDAVTQSQEVLAIEMKPARRHGTVAFAGFCVTVVLVVAAARKLGGRQTYPWRGEAVV